MEGHAHLQVYIVIFFKVYALNELLDLPGNSTKADIEKAMSEHIIGFGELMGYYKRG